MSWDISKAVLVFPCGTVFRLYPRSVEIRFPGDGRFAELTLEALMVDETQRRAQEALPPLSLPAEILKELQSEDSKEPFNGAGRSR